MTQSVHLETTSGSGGRNTSTWDELTDAGYKILKILENLENRPEFDISTVQANAEGIFIKYKAAHKDEKPTTIKNIIKAEIQAFITMELITKQDNVQSIFGQNHSGLLTLTQNGKDRMVKHEEALRAIENNPDINEQDEDEHAVKPIHYSLLKATKDFEEASHGGVKTYIVRKAIKGYKENRTGGNLAFEQLIEKGCINEHKPGDHMPTRFTLSSRGQHILDKKPKKFTDIPELPSAQPPAKNHG